MSESKQQTTAASASDSTPQKKQPNGAGAAGKNTALTPLKVEARNLEVDDTLFTEAFVRKFSPRSMEACKLLGVLPEELVLRSYENFFEHGISPNIQKLRYQDYEQMRQETIAMVREERLTLVHQGWTEHISPQQKLKMQAATLKAMMLPADMSPSRSHSNTTSPTRGVSAGASRPAAAGEGNMQVKTLGRSATTGDLGKSGASSTSPQRNSVLPQLMPEELLLKMEQERLRKTRMRQNKEIESMMAYELKVAQMLAKQQQKLEVRKQKEVELAAHRKEERFRQAEKRRLWELQKLEEEEKVKQANVQSMQRLNAQEQKHLQELAEKDEERKREANRKAAERRKKKLELELRAQQNMERQMEMAREREAEMAERDRRRREKLEDKRERLAAEHAREKAEAMRRVQMVLDANNRGLEEKRDEYTRKMEDMESRLKAFEDLKQQIANEKAEEIRAKEERRLAALHDSRSQLDGRIHGILDKKAKHDLLKDELESKAREQHVLKMELRRLNKIRKQANVERLKRMQEYHRTSLNEKLSEEAKRLKELEVQKKQLMAKRQQNAINMFRQKEALMKMFSDMTQRRNWEALSKMQIKDGQLSQDGSESNSHSNTMSSPLKSSAGRSNQYDSDDEHGNNGNLLDALHGLKKAAKGNTKKEKKTTGIDDYLKNQNRQASLQKSRSQGSF